MNQLKMKFHKINEGAFKDLDDKIVSVDDPDYEQKVKDQTFKNFQDADHNRMKSVREDWINTYITFYSDNTPTTWVLLHPVNKHLLKGHADWYIDDNMAIHLLSNDKNPTFHIEYDALIGGNEIIGELPYKIAECQGNLEVAGHLRSLKNFPDYIPGYFQIVDHHKNADEYLSLEGCPQKIEKGCYMNNLNIASLKGGPKYVGKTFSVSGNALTTLEYCPEYIGGDIYADNNNLETLKFLPKKVGRYTSLNIKGNCIPKNEIAEIAANYYLNMNGIRLNPEQDQFDQCYSQ